MWTGYDEALVRYGLEVCRAWTAEGRRDTCADSLRDGLPERGTGPLAVRSQAEPAGAGELPPWLGAAEFHASHRSALLRKDPAFYRARFPEEPDDLAYVWPASDPAHRV